MTKSAITTPPLSRGMKEVCKMTISVKEISVAEKEQSEALQTATNHNKTLFPPERKKFAK